MGKIEGVNLKEYIKQSGKPIKGDLGLRWLKEIVEILDRVHSQDIIHRDIKPQNIMLQPDGKLVLIDFGAVTDEGIVGGGTETATATSGTQTATHTAGGTRFFSKGYVAPEQIEGKAIKQSDIYSLGRTFVYLLTAKELNDPIIYDADNDRINWRQYAQGVSPQLADLIDSMIQRVPSQRPANTQVILQQLQQVGEINNIRELIGIAIQLIISTSYDSNSYCDCDRLFEIGRDIGRKLTRETEVLLIENILTKIREMNDRLLEMRFYWLFTQEMNELNRAFGDLLIGVWNIGRKGPIDNNNAWQFINSIKAYDYYCDLSRFLGVMEDYGFNNDNHNPDLDIILPLYLTSEEIKNGVDKHISVDNVGMCLVPVPPERKLIKIRGKGKFDAVTQQRGNLYFEVIGV